MNLVNLVILVLGHAAALTAICWMTHAGPGTTVGVVLAGGAAAALAYLLGRSDEAERRRTRPPGGAPPPGASASGGPGVPARRSLPHRRAASSGGVRTRPLGAAPGPRGSGGGPAGPPLRGVPRGRHAAPAQAARARRSAASPSSASAAGAGAADGGGQRSGRLRPRCRTATPGDTIRSHHLSPGTWRALHLTDRWPSRGAERQRPGPTTTARWGPAAGRRAGRPWATPWSRRGQETCRGGGRARRAARKLPTPYTPR